MMQASLDIEKKISFCFIFSENLIYQHKFLNKKDQKFVDTCTLKQSWECILTSLFGTLINILWLSFHRSWKVHEHMFICMLWNISYVYFLCETQHEL